MSKLEILNSCDSRIPRKFLTELDSWLRARLATQVSRDKLGLLKRDLVAVFVGRAQGRKLNQDFRGRNYATDVLSFAPVEDGSLGELVFCYDVIARQAVEHDLSFRFELAYMYIHGVLHLLGYDHERGEREARKMFALQDELFEKFCSGN